MTKYAEQMHQKANIRFGLAALLLIIATIFIIWPDYQQLRESQADIVSTDQQIVNAEANLAIERDAYRKLKDTYNKSAVRDQQTIAAVLPESAHQTDIVRTLEAKVNELAGSDTSLFLETVNFSKVSVVRDSDHLYMPIDINIVGAKEKLMAFLRYLEKTGSTNTNEEPSRFIDVQEVSMQIKDRGSATDMEQGIMMDISANAYILPSLEEINASKKK